MGAVSKVVPAESEHPSCHERAGAGQEEGDADEKLKAKYGCVKHDKVFLSLALSPRNDSLRGQTHCLYSLFDGFVICDMIGLNVKEWKSTEG